MSKIEKPKKHRKYEKNIPDGSLFDFLIYMTLGVKKYKENFELTKKINFSVFSGFSCFLAVFNYIFEISISIFRTFFSNFFETKWSSAFYIPKL